jgi:hypothetical protein
LIALRFPFLQRLSSDVNSKGMQKILTPVTNYCMPILVITVIPISTHKRLRQRECAMTTGLLLVDLQNDYFPGGKTELTAIHVHRAFMAALHGAYATVMPAQEFLS